MKTRWLLLAVLCGGSSLWGSEDAARWEAMESRLESLSRELTALKEASAETLSTTAPLTVPAHGLAPAAAKVYHVKDGATLGGYGEMVYQNFDGSRDDGAASGKKDQIDFLRFVLYAGYRFNERWLVNSEIEFEHAAEDKRGEVSVEMVNLDYLWTPSMNVRAGLLLLPVGFLNEMHEPTTYHGALRPNVERNIIPTTWRENGAGFFGQTGPLSYRAYVVNGFQVLKDTATVGGSTNKVKGFSAESGFRDGRQKGSSALAEDLAVVGRLDFTGVPGLLLGGSYYTGESGQGAVVNGQELDARVTLWETRGEWAARGAEIRALYARGTVSDAALINQGQGVTGNDSVGEVLWGSYVQGAFNVLSLTQTSAYLAPFVRYERYNTQARVPAGYTSNPANDRTELIYGLTYRPIPAVALKGEFQNNNNRAGTGVDQWNLAVGYAF